MRQLEEMLNTEQGADMPQRIAKLQDLDRWNQSRPSVRSSREWMTGLESVASLETWAANAQRNGVNPEVIARLVEERGRFGGVPNSELLPIITRLRSAAQPEQLGPDMTSTYNAGG